MLLVVALQTLKSLVSTLLGIVICGVVLLLKRDFSMKKNKELAEELQELTEKAVEEIGAKSEKITLESGIKLHVVTAGPEDGERMIMLHGFPESWYTWKKHIAHFANLGYRVVAPDMRGYNLSEKPEGIENYTIDKLTGDVLDLVKAVTKSQEEKVVLLAHDWGGVIGWKFVMENEERVSRLVVLNGPHPVAFAKTLRSLKQKLMSWYVFFFQLPYLPEFSLLGSPLITARTVLTKNSSDKSTTTEQDVRYFASGWCQPRAMTSMMNYYRAFVRGKQPKNSRAKVIQIPTLLLWGVDDSALSLELTKGLEEKWVPNIQVKYVEKCSHWITREAPAKVQEHVSEFLGRK